MSLEDSQAEKESSRLAVPAAEENLCQKKSSFRFTKDQRKKKSQTREERPDFMIQNEQPEPLVKVSLLLANLVPKL